MTQGHRKHHPTDLPPRNMPRIYRALLAMEAAMYVSGEAWPKRRSLMRLSLAVAIGCDACLPTRVERAVAAGASCLDLAKAIRAGESLGGRASLDAARLLRARVGARLSTPKTFSLFRGGTEAGCTPGALSAARA